jgi:hypothetical protein
MRSWIQPKTSIALTESSETLSLSSIRTPYSPGVTVTPAPVLIAVLERSVPCVASHSVSTPAPSSLALPHHAVSAGILIAGEGVASGEVELLAVDVGPRLLGERADDERPDQGRVGDVVESRGGGLVGHGYFQPR